MSSYTSRRTYLLNRMAWGLVAIAIVYLIWGDAYKWPVVIVLAVLAGLCWWIAGSIEKKRKNQHDRSCDEDGNARPNVM